jgi:hypothetical protein
MTRFTSVPGISRRLISLVPSKMRLMREPVLLVLDFLQMRQHLFADELFAGVGQPDLVRGEVFVDEWVAGSRRFDQEGPADGSCLIRLSHPPPSPLMQCVIRSRPSLVKKNRPPWPRGEAVQKRHREKL